MHSTLVKIYFLRSISKNKFQLFFKFQLFYESLPNSHGKKKKHHNNVTDKILVYFE